MPFQIMSLCLLLPLFVQAQQSRIIPHPLEITMREGYFLIDAETSIRFDKTQPLKPAVDFFASAIKNISGLELSGKKPGKKTIDLVIEKNPDLNDEGYRLSVTPRAILIKANGYAGIFYGMLTILQTLPPVRTNAALQAPCMQVVDQPRFKWRGMHLDVSRHFFSPDFIKEYIDLLSAYKMNTFHWHLTDDSGWRIEIKKYPALTAIGAWRVDYTDIAWGSRPQAKPGEIPTYGGYYTQEQLKEIAAYAKIRNVTIVPEIEMPGHAASAIASYPQLSCSQKPQLPLTGGNYSNISSSYCAGNDEVFAFLQDVLSEVMSVFPSAYIHIGGDETDKAPWKKCGRCQARIKKEGLKNEEELQSYFIKRIEKFIVSKKRKMIGWDEILEGGLAPEAAVMSWRGEAGGIEAAKMNHEAVMTPGTPCYFDHYQAGPEGEPAAIGGFNTLKKVYDYEPIPKELPADKHKFILGAQANVWTEFITAAAHLEYMVLPRMLALAEAVWSTKKDWDDFNRRLQFQFKSFEQKGFRYSPGNFTVDIKPVSDHGKLEVSLFSEIPNAAIYYTVDGTLPAISSLKYSQPIPIENSQTIKATSALNGRVMNMQPAQQSFIMHKAAGGNVTYLYPPSTYYPADGPNTLTDGVRGKKAHQKYWHGFAKNNIAATVDMGRAKNISRLSLGCLQNYGAYIFLPKEVIFELSVDGNTFVETGHAVHAVSAEEKAIAIKDFEVKFLPQKARYIRVTAIAIETCPKGHPGEGQSAWTFADEIVAE